MVLCRLIYGCPCKRITWQEAKVGDLLLIKRWGERADREYALTPTASGRHERELVSGEMTTGFLLEVEKDGRHCWIAQLAHVSNKARVLDGAAVLRMDIPEDAEIWYLGHLKLKELEEMFDDGKKGVDWSLNFLDSTQWKNNTGKPAGWRWDGDYLARYQMETETRDWVGEDDLFLPADEITSISDLLYWMEHMGKKPRTSKRELIDMVRCWAERFAKSSMTAHSASTDTELHDWLVWASENGSDFLKATAEAALLGGSKHYNLLRPVLVELEKKWPKPA
jgi:hypothetical protein